jgi:hypothetical protein
MKGISSHQHSSDKLIWYKTRKNSIIIAFIFLLGFISVETKGQASTVRIRKENNAWQLLINGHPFYVKGVVGDTYLEKVKENGGNSIRTGFKKEQLDNAFHLKLNALVNLPARAERDGMNYNDTSEIRKQTERIISIVEKTKNHPAVLMWAIGNELDYIPPLKPFNPKVWDAINEAAKAIHKIDPNHPVMTVIGTSMMEKVADIRKRCPDIDLLGINTYGDIYTLPDTLKKYGWVKPYIITEWGPDGYWEVPKTPWGAPYEQTGRAKYLCYEKKYLNAMNPENSQCLGSYVFYWSGFKQETTHTWFCMFDSTGLESPLIGLMHNLWTGLKKNNQAPIADSLNIGSFVGLQPIILNPGSNQTAKAAATDPDNDSLKYKWEIRPEANYASYAGQGEKVPQPVRGLVSGSGKVINFTTPSKSGAYRLFVYVFDGHNHFSTANLPFFVLPVQDTQHSGQYVSRTMNLLQKSTAHNKNTVKILVYGQSISEQEWWLEVKRTVISRFPDANVIMENRAIGGFAAQLLYKTVEMDVSSFYPDLVLLHIYGDNRYYETVLKTIRGRTAAEVAIMTDHYTGENAWSDTMSYHILPAFAEKYKCEIINIRDPWKRFLTENSFEPSRLLKDGVHLNSYGNFLMAELVKPLFTFKPGFPADQFGLCRTYVSGKDFIFHGDTLTMTFYGNKAEVIAANSGTYSADSLKVLVDGKPPSSFEGCWFMTRPYNNSGMKWPWELPAMIHVDHSKPWISEEWTCTFTHAEPPYSDFSFSIKGSVTGPDGKGTSGADFASPSGRVIIHAGDAEQGGDWHLNRSFQVLKTITRSGDEVKWKTYSISKDYYMTLKDISSSDKNTTILFQGIPNSKHTLKLIRTGTTIPSVTEIRIFKPYLDN